MSALTVAGHQPHYLPWMGYVDKISKVDVFCLTDCIPFDEKLYQHRNRIRSCSGAGEEWLVVPVVNDGDSPPLIQDLAIDNSADWARDHWSKIKASYEKAPHFRTYAPYLEDLYSRRWERLADLNAFMLQGLIEFFGFRTRLTRASSLGVRAEDGGVNLYVQVCEKLGADTYMSGAGGRCPYVDEEAFDRAGITHVRHEFTHPVYPQMHTEFVPGLAVVDLIFSCGQSSRKFFRSE